MSAHVRCLLLLREAVDQMPTHRLTGGETPDELCPTPLAPPPLPPPLPPPPPPAQRPPLPARRFVLTFISSSSKDACKSHAIRSAPCWPNFLDGRHQIGASAIGRDARPGEGRVGIGVQCGPMRVHRVHGTHRGFKFDGSLSCLHGLAALFVVCLEEPSLVWGSINVRLAHL